LILLMCVKNAEAVYDLFVHECFEVECMPTNAHTGGKYTLFKSPPYTPLNPTLLPQVCRCIIEGPPLRRENNFRGIFGGPKNRISFVFIMRMGLHN